MSVVSSSPLGSSPASVGTAADEPFQTTTATDPRGQSPRQSTSFASSSVVPPHMLGRHGRSESGDQLLPPRSSKRPHRREESSPLVAPPSSPWPGPLELRPSSASPY